MLYLSNNKAASYIIITLFGVVIYFCEYKGKNGFKKLINILIKLLKMQIMNYNNAQTF